MNEFLNKWFESKIERITIIVALIIGIIVATLAMIIELVGIENRPLVAIMIGIFAITLIFVIRGKTEFGRWLIPFVSFATVALLVYRGGLRDGATLALPLVISIGGLFLWRGGNILFGTLSIITAFIVGYGEANGFIKNYLSHTTSINDAFLITILLLGQTGLQDLLMRRLSKYLREANEETILEQKANQELRALQATLEERIHERTAALERTTLAVERRASQLQAISDIARTIASIQELSELLPRITELISEYFGFYHVGIFLLDEKKEYAELRAANSEGGKRMLARSHRLRVGYQGVVGFAARQGRARIALDTGEDAVFFDNPDLPTTRSEAALPLILGDEVIGVLDVQSEIPEAFSEDDLDVLNTLAFQVSIA
ncbi:MAG: GAF domain-containing protein, partial [Anaerolineales bacterium]